MAKKNPILQQKYDEGFAAGMKFAKESSVDATAAFLQDKFDGLDQVPGIGAKTYEKIVEHFGREYFREGE